MRATALRTTGADETRRVAARLGGRLRPGDLILLEGPLGAGKTVFVRGLAEGLGLEPAVVRSPTFVFHHVYGRPPALHHLDLYRLGPGADVTFLDLEDLLEVAPVAVEWGSYADLAWLSPLTVSIEPGDGEQRRLMITSAEPRILEAWGPA